jgi:hypothetical protein
LPPRVDVVRALDPALASRIRSISTRGLIAVNIGLAIGFAYVVYRNLAQPGGVIATDFTVFWSGWTLILQGRAPALYDEAAQRATQELLMHGMHFEGGLMAFLNPPHAALAGVPFGWLANHAGEQRAFIVWTLGNVALAGMFMRALSKEWGATARQQQLMLVCALAGFYPLFCAVKNGQPSLLLALAILGVYRAEKAAKYWTGAAWLVVLSIKPQLVPIVALYLASRRCWRLLACASVMLAVVAVITAVALGPAIWFQYLRQVGSLEHFWGSGTPDYMLNVRGALSRLFGLDQRRWIDAVSYAGWLLAMVVAAVVLARRRVAEAPDARPAYAFAIALGLFANPHLFIHDAIIWTIPLLLYAAALRDEGREWRPFAAFALSWPVWFAAAGKMDIKSGHLTWVDPHTWLFIAATAIIGCRWPGDAARLPESEILHDLQQIEPRVAHHRRHARPPQDIDISPERA